MRPYSTLLCLAGLIGLLSLASPGRAEGAARSQPADTGTLSGHVAKGPISPVARPGSGPSEAPAPGVKLLLFNPAGRLIASVATDENGDYRLQLPPGTYRLELAPDQGWLISKDLPATVTITRGRETRLDLCLDTGLR